MKKFISIIPFIIAMAMPAMAQKVSYKEVIDSSMTVTIVSCSSSTATLIDSTTTAVGMLNRTFVSFQNMDTTNQICIGANSAMSCSAGDFRVPENYGLVSIPVTKFKLGGTSNVISFWCKSASTTGASNLSVIQGF